jgi:hypothetical protein
VAGNVLLNMSSDLQSIAISRRRLDIRTSSVAHGTLYSYWHLKKNLINGSKKAQPDQWEGGSMCGGLHL